MARKRRGWGGDPPATDSEAAQRIVVAAVDLIARTGAAITIADVAESLEVTRQTVYRYFSTADELMRAAAIASVDGFLDQLAAHVRGIHDPADAMTEGVNAAHMRGIHDPADAMTEGVMFTLDAVAAIPHLAILLSAPSEAARPSEVTSDLAQDFGMRMITRFDVDWQRYGYDDAALRDLVEFTLRTMLSFFVAPNVRPPEELRRFLTRWLGSAILAQSVKA